jgi:hypothetical protein
MGPPCAAGKRSNPPPAREPMPSVYTPSMRREKRGFTMGKIIPGVVQPMAVERLRRFLETHGARRRPYRLCRWGFGRDDS